jgi:Restriction endonuclease fold toxin 5
VPATPFDAAVQAALIALAEQDAAASMASATSASTHAAGADASVASVVAEEAQSAESLSRVGEQLSSSGMYSGGSASAMPLAASVPSTGGGPPGGGGGSPPVAGLMRPPVASPPTSTPSATPGTGMPGTGAPAHQAAPVPSSAPTPAAVAPASTGAAAPSVGAPAPAGRGTIQMLGGPHGLGSAPQAPYSPLPLEPGQPAPPPPFPLPPHNTPLQPPVPPSWANPPLEESAEKAKDQYKDLTKKIEQHNSWRPDPSDSNAVEWYNAEAKYYNEWKAQLEGQLWSWNKEYTPALTAVNADVEPWTGPAPPPPPAHPHPNYQGPGSWVPVNDSMSAQAAAYQEYITGHPITETYKLPGFDVSFDGYENNYVTEVKSFYTNFYENGQWKPFFEPTGLQSMITQARSQVEAVLAHGGLRLQWVFAQSEMMALVKRTFEGIPMLKGMIEYVYIPP